MKIYIVTAGSYEDYGIEAVFTDKAKAEYYCAKNNREVNGLSWPYRNWEYHIEEYYVSDKSIDLDNVDTEDKPGYVYSIAANMVQDVSVVFKSDYENYCSTEKNDTEYVWLSEKNEELAYKKYFERRAKRKKIAMLL